MTSLQNALSKAGVSPSEDFLLSEKKEQEKTELHNEKKKQISSVNSNGWMYKTVKKIGVVEFSLGGLKDTKEKPVFFISGVGCVRSFSVPAMVKNGGVINVNIFGSRKELSELKRCQKIIAEAKVTLKYNNNGQSYNAIDLYLSEKKVDSAVKCVSVFTKRMKESGLRYVPQSKSQGGYIVYETLPLS